MDIYVYQWTADTEHEVAEQSKQHECFRAGMLRSGRFQLCSAYETAGAPITAMLRSLRRKGHGSRAFRVARIERMILNPALSMSARIGAV